MRDRAAKAIDNPRRLQLVELFAHQSATSFRPANRDGQSCAPEDRDEIAEVVSVQAAARREDDRVGLSGVQLVGKVGAGRIRPPDRIRRQKLQKVRMQREDRSVAPFPRQRDESLGRNQALGADARLREEGRQFTGRWSAVAVGPATDHAQAGPEQRVSFRCGARAKCRLQFRLLVQQTVAVLGQLIGQQREKRGVPHRHQAEVRTPDEMTERLPERFHGGRWRTDEGTAITDRTSRC